MVGMLHYNGNAMASSRTIRRSGFTLIELMVVVLILGVLAAIAIPSMGSYINRSRASEASANLNALFKSAVAVYSSERATRGMAATVVSNCVAEPTPLYPSAPTSHKQAFSAIEGFDQLNFHIADYVYFGYGIQSIGSDGAVTCFASTTAREEVYTFFAHGDLNDNGTLSTFELAVGSDADNQLFHARGMYINNEVE